MKLFSGLLSFFVLVSMLLTLAGCKSNPDLTLSAGEGSLGENATVITPMEFDDMFTSRDADTTYSIDEAVQVLLSDDASTASEVSVEIS